jgi:hypothetical protein
MPATRPRQRRQKKQFGPQIPQIFADQKKHILFNNLRKSVQSADDSLSFGKF